MIKNISWMLAIFIVGCGIQIEEKKSSLPRYVKSSTGKAIELKNYDSVCSNTSNEYKYPVVYPSTAGEEIFYYYNPVNVLDSLNRFYDEILLGGEILRKGKLINQKDIAFYEFQDHIVESPTPLSLCPGEEYDLDSYQSAAIHINHILELSHKSIANKIHSLKPIDLKIAPKIQLELEGKVDNTVVVSKKVLINNAYYDALKKEIVYLPQGTNDNGYIPFNGIPLWHIPITASHEYGHHIFSGLMDNYYLDLNNEGNNEHNDDHQDDFRDRNYQLCFDNREKVSEINELHSKANEKVDTNTVIRAINEGFADLFANYSLPQKYTSLGILPCLNNTREVDEEYFANGERKLLSEEAIEQFLNGNKKPLESCLESVDYQDPHILGALIAHMIDSVFSALELDKDTKLEFIIKWIRDLNKHYDHLKSKSPREFLVESLLLFSNNFKKQDSYTTVCHTILSKAPILESELLCPDLIQ